MRNAFRFLLFLGGRIKDGGSFSVPSVPETPLEPSSSPNRLLFNGEGVSFDGEDLLFT